jgi:hypothetical protein
MAVPAECFKIVRVERYERIADVLRCEMYLVMYYLAWLATFNAQAKVTLEHELPKIAPLLRQIELLCELLHNSSEQIESLEVWFRLEAYSLKGGNQRGKMLIY